MTTVIRQNKDWLNEQISEAVDYIVDTQLDSIKQMIANNILEQLYFSGCSMHSQDDTEQCGKLVIEIDLPDPMTCGDLLESTEGISAGMML